MSTVKRLLVTCSLLLLATPAIAQMEAMGEALTLPQPSPKASVTQQIGVTEVSIAYCRPSVKGREVYGTKLVPYGGDPGPWRAGANENTKFTFSTDVTINGKPLAAGSYGFHIIPTETEWTLIFSNTDNAWGSYSYDPAEDALRVTVKPEDIANVESLEYGFDNLTPDSADVYMAWEKKQISFTVAVDLKETVLASLRDQMRGHAGYAWNANYNAAKWCLDNDVITDEALGWATASVNRYPIEFNLRVQGQLLAKMGKKDEAKAALEAALAVANEKRKGDIQKEIDAL